MTGDGRDRLRGEQRPLRRDGRDRVRGEYRPPNPDAGVLKIPGAAITRRENKANPGARGSRRSAQEIFNRAYAEWKQVEYSDHTNPIDACRCRQIKKKIRNALYNEGSDRIQEGTLTYREATKEHGTKLHHVRKRLDGAFTDLELAEDSWAADFFIQDVFQSDRSYKSAGREWVHPRHRLTDTLGFRRNSSNRDIEECLDEGPEPHDDFNPSGSVNGNVFSDESEEKGDRSFVTESDDDIQSAPPTCSPRGKKALKGMNSFDHKAPFTTPRPGRRRMDLNDCRTKQPSPKLKKSSGRRLHAVNDSVRPHMSETTWKRSKAAGKRRKRSSDSTETESERTKRRRVGRNRNHLLE